MSGGICPGTMSRSRTTDKTDVIWTRRRHFRRSTEGHCGRSGRGHGHVRWCEPLVQLTDDDDDHGSGRDCCLRAHTSTNWNRPTNLSSSLFIGLSSQRGLIQYVWSQPASISAYPRWQDLPNKTDAYTQVGTARVEWPREWP